MITREQVKVGARLKNILQTSFFCDNIATVIAVYQDSWSIRYDGDGESTIYFSWNCRSLNMFEALPEYRPATLKDIVLGAKVRCNVNSNIRFKTGTLIAIRDDSAWSNCRYYDIQWDDGYTVNVMWLCSPYQFTCWFDVLGNIKKRKPKKVIPDIPLDPTLPILEAGYLQDRMRKQFR